MAFMALAWLNGADGCRTALPPNRLSGRITLAVFILLVGTRKSKCKASLIDLNPPFSGIIWKVSPKRSFFNALEPEGGRRGAKEASRAKLPFRESKCHQLVPG
jgi:hypothetical protein